MSESDLDVRRYKILCHLATGCSNKEAAERSGTSLSTVERLKRNPEFKLELAKAVNGIYRAGLTKLSLGIETAVSELLRIINSPDTPDRLKLNAISILLSQAAIANNLALDDRLSELEEQMKIKSIQQTDPDDEDDEDDWYPTPNDYQLSPAD